jgi:penicillin-binding protein 2
VRAALEGVVSEPHGTGGRSRLPGVKVAGKTGTAQVVGLEHTDGLDEHEVEIRHRDHAWFVAYAPADAPEVVVAALVEHGGHGGSAAAPLVQKVLASYFGVPLAPPPPPAPAPVPEVPEPPSDDPVEATPLLPDPPQDSVPVEQTRTADAQAAADAAGAAIPENLAPPAEAETGGGVDAGDRP